MDEDTSIDEDEPMQFDEELGFLPQKKKLYNKFLPYSDKINSEMLSFLKDIKHNLGKAVLLKEIRPSATAWGHKLSRYLYFYGFCFSKEDHIIFIKLLYEVITTPDQELSLVTYFCQILNNLLSKRRLLTPQDLQLEWRPLYNLYVRTFNTSLNKLNLILLPSNAEYIIKSVIRSCRAYFPLSSTAEMLEEWRPLLCPYDEAMSKALNYIELFIPTCFDKDNRELTWNIWLPELMDLWKTFYNIGSYEGPLFWLFARLSWRNIGYVDWTDHFPLIYTRILRSFPLPVRYKKTGIKTMMNKGLEVSAISMFLVSNLGGKSDTQQNINQLFKTFESYYHPSNSGPWTMLLHSLLSNLSHYFIQRLHRENYQKPSWEIPIPEDKKLTEKDITDFVECLLPPAQLAMYSRSGCREITSVFHNLSLIRPKMTIPPLIERLYSALDTRTEPHRLIAALQCLTHVARSMVNSKDSFPEGITHVYPLLLLSLPGIDPNDTTKCVATLQFISTFASIVTFIDCSSAIDECSDLSKETETVCLQSSGCRDFVLQFMDRSLELIESFTLSQTSQLDRETTFMNREESMVAIELKFAFQAVLTQCHPTIFDIALEHLAFHIKRKGFETKVAGKLIAIVCRYTCEVHPQKTLKAFLPVVCKQILIQTENADIQNEENLNDDFLFNLLLLSKLVTCHGSYLHPYIDTLTEILKKTIHLKCKEGYKLSSNLLQNIINSLTCTVSEETRSLNFDWDLPFEQFLPIDKWGAPGDVNNLDIKWLEPTTSELNLCKNLVHQFLVPELETLKKVSTGDTTLSRDDLHQSLIIILNIMYSSGGFPRWEEPVYHLYETSCERNDVPLALQNKEIKVELEVTGYPSNVRLAVTNVILDLANSLLNRESDDTKSFMQISGILYNCMFAYGVNKAKQDTRWKHYDFQNTILGNNLFKRKRYIRSLFINRIVLQHEGRVLKSGVTLFTDTHKKIVQTTMCLATSRYSEVRKVAQGHLSSIFSHHAYSYRLVLPNLLKSLKKDPNDNHKEFKGALYVLLGMKDKSFLVKNNYEVLKEIWPTLLAAQHSEKPSIVRLYEACFETIAAYMGNFSFCCKASNEALNIAKLLLAAESPRKDGTITEDQISRCHLKCEQKELENKQHYNDLILQVVDLINNGNLHWCHHRIGQHMIGMLIRPHNDVPYPAAAIRIFMNNLINDNIYIRKGALHFVVNILKIQKRPHKKISLDPSKFKGYSTKFMPGDDRPDNSLMQYNRHLNMTHELRETHHFVHHTWNGWYIWGKELEVYAPPSEQPDLRRDESSCTPAEREVMIFFKDQYNLEKFISFLSLEEKKGTDKFNLYRYLLFKGLFRNFGDTFLDDISKHLVKLVDDPQESSQRCAAEIIAGALRGSKHWPYDEVKNLWELVLPLLNTALDNISIETSDDWTIFMTHVSMDRDPNIISPLIELMLEDPFQQKQSSFNTSKRLQLLIFFLSQQEWRVAEPCHRVLEYLKPHLAHPFKNIRDSIGILLDILFKYDLKVPWGAKTLSPHITEFVEVVLPQLSILLTEDHKDESSTTININDKKDDVITTEESGKQKNGCISNESDDKKEALRLMDTLCRWLMCLSYRSCAIPPDVYRFLPYLCHLENMDTDVELHTSCTMTLSILSRSIILNENLPTMVKAVTSVCEMGWWKARASALEVLQVAVFNNIFTLLTNVETSKAIKNLVLKSLHDPRIEVRQVASSVLSGFFHCNFMTPDKSTLKSFKSLLKKVKEIKDDSSALIDVHAGVLGLCAYVNAFPYDVPQLMPDVLITLCDLINKKQPISTTIRETVRDFKRTHYDNWQEHEKKFTSDQLEILTDIHVSPSYYA